MSLFTLISLYDLPFIASILAGIFLPELYLKMQWSYRKLVTIRLLTFLAACVLATYVNHAIYPTSDPGTIFTRAFVFIGFSRLIILSSHQAASHNHQAIEPQQNHTSITREEE